MLAHGTCVEDGDMKKEDIEMAKNNANISDIEIIKDIFETEVEIQDMEDGIKLRMNFCNNLRKIQEYRRSL